MDSLKTLVLLIVISGGAYMIYKHILQSGESSSGESGSGESGSGESGGETPASKISKPSKPSKKDIMFARSLAKVRNRKGLIAYAGKHLSPRITKTTTDEYTIY